jgi:hypothetical protein
MKKTIAAALMSLSVTSSAVADGGILSLEMLCLHVDQVRKMIDSGEAKMGEYTDASFWGGISGNMYELQESGKKRILLVAVAKAAPEIHCIVAALPERKAPL